MSNVTFAIGDIHGCYDLLIKLMEKIHLDIENHNYNDVTIVFLGDYIDRGPQSKQVLDFIINYNKYNKILLCGNHEHLFISTKYPSSDGFDVIDMWMDKSFGGQNTYESYVQGGEFDFETFNNHRDFLENNLEMWYEDEFAYYTHAGLGFAGHPKYQEIEDLMWNFNRDFYSGKYVMDKPVVHGHTCRREVINNKYNIGVDTGGHVYGRLSSVVLSKDRREFINADKTEGI